MSPVETLVAAALAEARETFIRASGPGGQNVNKVATAVELRFDVRRSDVLTSPVRRRLEALAGRRLSNEGVLVLRAEQQRTQARNREDARERLADLIRAAAVPPKPRVKTRPPRASKAQRLEDKGRRATVKRLRKARPDSD